MEQTGSRQDLQRVRIQRKKRGVALDHKKQGAKYYPYENTHLSDGSTDEEIEIIRIQTICQEPSPRECVPGHGGTNDARCSG
jgi:hypothetical protein